MIALCDIRPCGRIFNDKKKKNYLKASMCVTVIPLQFGAPSGKKVILSTVLKSTLLFQLVPHDQRTRNKSVIYFFLSPSDLQDAKQWGCLIFNIQWIMQQEQGEIRTLIVCCSSSDLHCRRQLISFGTLGSLVLLPCILMRLINGHIGSSYYTSMR